MQLKRFHYLNGRWIKSHKIVDFPSLSLDLTDYLAAVPAATLQRYKSIKRKERVSFSGIEKPKFIFQLLFLSGAQWDH